MISTSHVHRSFSMFAAYMGILPRSLFETGLRSKIGDFRKDPVRCKPILIYRASGFIRGESTVAATGIIQNISKFDGTDFDVATNPPRKGQFDKSKHFEVLDDPLRPEPLYRTWCGYG